MFLNMGLGPWYRIGLSLSNAVIFAAITETIITCNTASHSLAYTVANYHYGLFGHEPGNLAADIREHPQWALLGVVLILQILADILFWLAVIIKGNKHFAMVWVMTIIVKNMYIALIFTMHDWARKYELPTALQRIFAFLWGTILFGFLFASGIQSYFYLSTEEGRVKISPLGQGFRQIYQFYRENVQQLAVVLLLAEITTNIHRSFHYTTTAFLKEANDYLSYVAPDEYGLNLSSGTLLLNLIGLILLRIREFSGIKKAWLFCYVILIIVHGVMLVYIVIDWSPVNIHPFMFNSFVALSLVHIAFKMSIFYIYSKSVDRSIFLSEERRRNRIDSGVSRESSAGPAPTRRSVSISVSNAKHENKQENRHHHQES